MPDVITALSPVENLPTKRYSFDVPDKELAEFLRALNLNLDIPCDAIKLGELRGAFNVTFSHRSDINVIGELQRHGINLKALS